MFRFKYVMFEDSSFVIIPEHVKHSEYMSMNNLKPVSAGFVDISENDVCCHGESVSLKLKANKEDGEIIKMSVTECVLRG